MIDEFYQQGDVLLDVVAELPSGKPVAPGKRGVVLAEGEVTGHAHRMADVENVKMIECEDGSVYIKVEKSSDLTHEEHNTITLPPGIYRRRFVKEYDHLEEEAREVAD